MIDLVKKLPFGPYFFKFQFKLNFSLKIFQIQYFGKWATNE